MPDTLLTGHYAVVGFAMDKSGVRSTSTSASFTIIDGTKPKMRILTPLSGDKVTIGDSLLVVAELSDNFALGSATLNAYAARRLVAGHGAERRPVPAGVGAADGSYAPGVRIDTVRAISGSSRRSTRSPIRSPSPASSGSSNNVDTMLVRVRMVAGPKVTFISPVQGDSANRNGGLTISLRATSPVGVLSLGFRIQSAAGWPVPIDSTVKVVYSPAPQDGADAGHHPHRSSAPPKGLLTITPILATSTARMDHRIRWSSRSAPVRRPDRR